MIEDFGKLLERWDASSLQRLPREGFPLPEVVARGSVLVEGAAEAEIGAAEQGPGLRLPPSYRTFLLHFHGAHASTAGCDFRTRFGSEVRHGFLSVQEVERVSVAWPQLVERWTDMTENVEAELGRRLRNKVRPPGMASAVSDYRMRRGGLLISRPHDLLCDVLVPDPRREWQLWSFGREGAIAYRSFESCLVQQAAMPTPTRQADPAALDALVAAVRNGEARPLNQLVEAGDPRANDLALDMLRASTSELRRQPSAEQEEHVQVASAALRRLADARAVPLLW